MGSSPRVRGKRAQIEQTKGRDVAHPRVCGENFSPDGSKVFGLGSSPRVRGKPTNPRSYRCKRGLIPACAGKTNDRNRDRRCRRAHPRVCGENVALSPSWRPRQGSSPRVRGKPCGAALGELHRGLIPACAGKTLRATSLSRRKRAHPRVCGENEEALAHRDRGSGSSPRVRGKQTERRNHQREQRLIPACAGKTGLSAVSRP